MPRPGSSSARGYGAEHQRIRALVAATVESGEASCWRCGQPIPPGAPWDLGHDDTDRGQYRGPEHRRCNRAAGGRKSHGALSGFVRPRR